MTDTDCDVPGRLPEGQDQEADGWAMVDWLILLPQERRYQVLSAWQHAAADMPDWADITRDVDLTDFFELPATVPAEPGPFAEWLTSRETSTVAPGTGWAHRERTGDAPAHHYARHHGQSPDERWTWLLRDQPAEKLRADLARWDAYEASGEDAGDMPLHGLPVTPSDVLRRVLAERAAADA